MKKKIYIFLSIICFIYFLGLGIPTAFSISMLWVWLLMSIGFGILAFRDKIDWLNKIPSKLKIVIRFCSLVLIIIFIVVEGFILWGMVDNSHDNLDYIIVLGAQVNGNTPSPALKRRLEKANSYLESNPQTTVIVSGGQGSDEMMSEAECMKNWLAGKGINAERIIVEDKSTTTAENLRYSFEYLKSLNRKSASIGVVTNNFHVFRSLAIGNIQMQKSADYGLDYQMYGIAADCDFYIMPHYMVREFFAIVVNTIKGELKFFK